MKPKISKAMITLVAVGSLLSYSNVNANESKIVESATIESTEEITKAGTYFITSAMKDDKGNEISKPVRVHVKYPKTNLNYDLQEGIDAHDILVLPNELETLNNNDLIVRGGAHAWSMVDGTALDIANVAHGKATQEFAISDVIYGTLKKTEVNVSVYTQDDIHLGFEEIYINYNAIFKNRYLLLTLLVLFLTVLPLLIYFIMFTYLQKKNKEARELLYKE